MNKTLVIHPEDDTTDFLCPIYRGMRDKTVIRKNISRKELLELADGHERVIMLGHGSPEGLFAANAFPDRRKGEFVVDKELVRALRDKDNIYIWCHADQFVQRHKLTGFYTGMFISEMLEALYYDLDVSQKSIDHSNKTFTRMVAGQVREHSSEIHRMVKKGYGLLQEVNPVIAFNCERLGCAVPNELHT